jgi:two-component system, OmpR family, phosphate regulon sensor histidine kinase PhoR
MADPTRSERLLTFLLLPAIVVGVLVLTGITFRTSFQQEQLRQRSVVEATLSLANEKTSRLDQLIIDQDNVVETEADVAHIETFATRWLKVASRQTPTVRAVIVLDRTSELDEVVAFASRRPGPEDDAFRHLLLHRVWRDLELAEDPRDQLRHLHETYEGKSLLLSYWQREHEGRRYLVVAWHDVPRIVHELLPILYRERDEQSRMNIVDESGGIVFGQPLSGGEFTIGRPFRTTLYKWRLNVSLLSAEELAESAARRRILEAVLVGLSGLVVIAGIVVVMVAVARERKLSNLKSDFVANVSHELKTPLSLVRMFGELLQTGRVDSEEKRLQYLQIIVSESERLGALIENVLDFAKVERGKAAYDFAERHLPEVVARAVEACRVRAERDGVQLDLRVEEGLPSAELDERAMEIAVINLVDNALKYAQGGRRIVIEVRAVDGFLEVSVTDEGHGIPPEDRRRIFERFVRGTGASQVRGSGIGLALVKHIAEAHGGKSWVEPAVTGGSRFAFTVRLEKARRSVTGGARVEVVG